MYPASSSPSIIAGAPGRFRSSSENSLRRKRRYQPLTPLFEVKPSPSRTPPAAVSSSGSGLAVPSAIAFGRKILGSIGALSVSSAVDGFFRIRIRPFGLGGFGFGLLASRGREGRADVGAVISTGAEAELLFTVTSELSNISSTSSKRRSSEEVTTGVTGTTICSSSAVDGGKVLSSSSSSSSSAVSSAIRPAKSSRQRSSKLKLCSSNRPYSASTVCSETKFSSL
ncbi:hypothetical protein TYRP_009421 [Tyrophagus putrescentiae]|nr:hypothetical protein TYRP_009421 [Tyrophagus putrescentiae]